MLLSARKMHQPEVLLYDADLRDNFEKNENAPAHTDEANRYGFKGPRAHADSG